MDWGCCKGGLRYRRDREWMRLFGWWPEENFWMDCCVERRLCVSGWRETVIWKWLCVQDERGAGEMSDRMGWGCCEGGSRYRRDGEGSWVEKFWMDCCVGKWLCVGKWQTRETVIGNDCVQERRKKLDGEQPRQSYTCLPSSSVKMLQIIQTFTSWWCTRSIYSTSNCVGETARSLGYY